MLHQALILAQDAAAESPPANDSIIVFGFWQIASIVGIIAVIVGYKVWKNKTMS